MNLMLARIALQSIGIGGGTSDPSSGLSPGGFVGVLGYDNGPVKFG